MFGTSLSLPDVFATALYIAFLVFWLMLVFHIMVDIVRSHDLSGPGKMWWILFILVLPLVGSLVYFVVRGGSMHERQAQGAPSHQRGFEEYIRAIANSKE